MRLIESVAFDKLVSVPDGYGGTETTWEEQFACRANFRYLRGSEKVIAARLEGVQPVVVTIRQQDASEVVTPDWRMRDVRRGTVYAVRTIIPSDDRRWFELTVESGVPA